MHGLTQNADKEGMAHNMDSHTADNSYPTHLNFPSSTYVQPPSRNTSKTVLQALPTTSYCDGTNSMDVDVQPQDARNLEELMTVYPNLMKKMVYYYN